MTSPDKKGRTMPKGGRKGGTSFPRVALSEALVYAKKLVAKTHVGPQPQDVIFAGVVGAKSGMGQVRIAALKQYGLIEGDLKTNYAATELAKQITAAPQEESQALHRQAALRPGVFKRVFDAFHGDAVSKAKLRQRASDLKVHPDEVGSFVDLYVSTMVTAGLASIDGDEVTHVTANESAASEAADEIARVDDVTGAEPPGDNERDAALRRESASTSAHAPESDPNTNGPRAVFNVNVTLDSSLDTEKLQRQLELLKRFGAI